MRVSHKSLFEKLRDDTVIQKCEQYAKWSLPQLMADLSLTRGQTQIVVERDYQEIGALLVNHLAPKLAKLLFPTTAPFFRIGASDNIKQMASQAGVPEAQLQTSLAKAEMTAVSQLFLNASYAQLIMMLKQLIVTGNALLYRDSKLKKCCTYGLQSYVTRRDGKGALLDCVLREYTFVEGLPADVQQTLRIANKAKYGRPEQQVEVYTRIHRELNGDKFVYKVTEEVDEYPVGEESSYPEHLCPWLPITWSLITGEHYGRGLVEDFAGGFAKLSDISEAYALYTIEALRVINLVSGTSGTDIDDLANAETGEYLRGDPASVAAHESGSSQKMQQAAQEVEAVFGRLAKAFMYQANTRDAERVTAYELQRDAQEAENTLGGAYSMLSTGIQVPLAHILLVETQGSMLPGLITGDIKLDVVAGIPALGRTGDVQNLMMASQEVAAVAPIAQLDKRISPTKVVDMIMAGRSVDTSVIFYTEEEQQANAQAEQQAQLGMQQLQASQQAAEQLGAMQEGSP